MTTTDYAQLTGDYTLDPAHTRIGFVARHAMVTKVRGAFNEFTGTAHFDVDHPSNSSVQVTIRAASIDTRNADRDAHLRGNDFLQMEQYPDITFHSTAVTRTDDTFAVTGDLTIKGVTRSTMIPLSYQGSATDPFGQHPHRFRGLNHDQPQGLRHHLERRVGNRGGAGGRQDRAGVRRLGDQASLMPPPVTTSRRRTTR